MFGSRGARPSELTSRRTMFKTSSVQPRWVMEMSFKGFTRLYFAQTSSGGTMMVAADVSRL